MSDARFVVGIDLGTTNSALAYLDTAELPRRLRDFPIPQLIGPGDVAARPTLPSLHHHLGEHELPRQASRWCLSKPPQTRRSPLRNRPRKKPRANAHRVRVASATPRPSNWCLSKPNRAINPDSRRRNIQLLLQHKKAPFI